MRIALLAAALCACGRANLDGIPRDAPVDAMIDARTGPLPGHSLTFDAVAAYATIDALAPVLAGPLTINFWYRPVANEGAAILVINNRNAVVPENLFYMQWDGQLGHFNYFDETTTRNDYTGVPPAEPAVWHFSGTTIDALGEGATYQDGTLEQSFSTTRTIPPDCRFSVGQDWDNGPVATDFASGLFDELTVWRTARTQDQIQYEQAYGVDPTDPDLLGYYTFESAVSDDSGHGRDGVLQGTATIVPTP